MLSGSANARSDESPPTTTAVATTTTTEDLTTTSVAPATTTTQSPSTTTQPRVTTTTAQAKDSNPFELTAKAPKSAKVGTTEPVKVTFRNLGPEAAGGYSLESRLL